MFSDFVFIMKKIAEPTFLNVHSIFLFFSPVPGSHHSCDVFTRKSQHLLKFVWGWCRKVLWLARQYLLVEWPSVSVNSVPLLVLQPFPPQNTDFDFSFFCVGALFHRIHVKLVISELFLYSQIETVNYCKKEQRECHIKPYKKCD